MPSLALRVALNSPTDILICIALFSKKNRDKSHVLLDSYPRRGGRGGGERERAVGCILLEDETLNTEHG